MFRLEWHPGPARTAVHAPCWRPGGRRGGRPRRVRVHARAARARGGGYLADQAERAERGTLVPFAQIRLADRRAVGCTAYWDPRFWPGRAESCAVEIGWTWLAASAQRTGLNVEAKLLLMEYAVADAGRGQGRLQDRRAQRSGPGAPSRASGRPWKVSCGTGRRRTCRARRACSATPRCSRSSPPNGPPRRRPCATASARWAGDQQRGRGPRWFTGGGRSGRGCARTARTPAR